MFVMLPARKSQGIFHRSVRGENGEIVKTLAFPPGEAVEVSKEDFPAIKDDIGKALVECYLDEKGRPKVGKAPEDKPEDKPEKPSTNSKPHSGTKSTSAKTGKVAK